MRTNYVGGVGNRQAVGVVRRCLRGGAAGLAASLVLLTSCQVPPPSVEQVRGYDLSSPRRAFESLVTAFQGQMLDEEFNCLSRRFRERHGLSQQTYRAFRDEFLAEQPRLRWALYRSTVQEVAVTSPRVALVTARIPVPLSSDPVLEFTFVAEDFWEVAVDGRTLGGDQGEDLDLYREGLLLTDTRGQDGPRLWARFNLDPELDPMADDLAVALAMGREWRLEDLRLVEKDEDAGR